MNKLISDILFPKHCLGCRRLGSYICLNCSNNIKVVTRQICPYCYKSSHGGLTHSGCLRQYGIDGIYSFFLYRRPLTDIIKNIKYHYVSDAIDELHKVLIASNTLPHKKIYQSLDSKSILTIVPSHHLRIKERGFCHITRLAKKENQYLNFILETKILSRVKNTKPQAKLENKKERYLNILNAFIINKNQLRNIKNKTMILFDDVWTTGYTIKEAAKILKKNGASKVYGLTLAR